MSIALNTLRGPSLANLNFKVNPIGNVLDRYQATVRSHGHEVKTSVPAAEAYRAGGIKTFVPAFISSCNTIADHRLNRALVPDQAGVNVNIFRTLVKAIHLAAVPAEGFAYILAADKGSRPVLNAMTSLYISLANAMAVGLNQDGGGGGDVGSIGGGFWDQS